MENKNMHAKPNLRDWNSKLPTEVSENEPPLGAISRDVSLSRNQGTPSFTRPSSLCTFPVFHCFQILKRAFQANFERLRRDCEPTGRVYRKYESHLNSGCSRSGKPCNAQLPLMPRIFSIAFPSAFSLLLSLTFFPGEMRTGIIIVCFPLLHTVSVENGVRNLAYGQRWCTVFV